jgi:hypothetical protein
MTQPLSKRNLLARPFSSREVSLFRVLPGCDRGYSSLARKAWNFISGVQLDHLSLVIEIT